MPNVRPRGAPDLVHSRGLLVALDMSMAIVEDLDIFKALGKPQPWLLDPPS